jgi:hypothetical protein
MEKKRSRAERHNFRPNASVGGSGGGDRWGRQQALPATDDMNWLYTVWLGSVSRRCKTRRRRRLIHLPRTSLQYRPLFLPSPFRHAMVVSWCSPFPPESSRRCSYLRPGRRSSLSIQRSGGIRPEVDLVSSCAAEFSEAKVMKLFHLQMLWIFFTFSLIGASESENIVPTYQRETWTCSLTLT